MPRNIRLFEALSYASIAIGVALVVLNVIGIGAMTGGSGVGFLLIVGLGGMLIIVALIWLAARKRKGWARWLLLILVVIRFFTNYPQLAEAIRSAPVLGWLQALQILLLLIALWFVFTGDARPWFRKDEPAAPRPV